MWLASDWDVLDVDFVGLPSLGPLSCDSLPTVAMCEQLKAQVLLRVATAASTALTWVARQVDRAVAARPNNAIGVFDEYGVNRASYLIVRCAWLLNVSPHDVAHSHNNPCAGI